MLFRSSRVRVVKRLYVVLDYICVQPANGIELMRIDTESFEIVTSA